VESKPGEGSTFWFTLPGTGRVDMPQAPSKSQGGASHHLPQGGHAEAPCVPGHCEHGVHAYLDDRPRRHESIH
jgi:hypothetical protein